MRPERDLPDNHKRYLWWAIYLAVAIAAFVAFVFTIIYAETGPEYFGRAFR